MVFEIMQNPPASRYMRANKEDVLIRPVNRPMRTISGYFVVSPEEAESLVRELHHWLENEREK